MLPAMQGLQIKYAKAYFGHGLQIITKEYEAIKLDLLEWNPREIFKYPTKISRTCQRVEGSHLEN